jgi:hypothetical protein
LLYGAIVEQQMAITEVGFQRHRGFVVLMLVGGVFSILLALKADVAKSQEQPTVSDIVTSQGTVLCEDLIGQSFTVNFSEFQRFSHSFNCISGDFVVDISGCAPDGAFSLHRPTGSAEIVGVVDRWQDYAQHFGPIMSHYNTKNEIYFAGGFNGSGEGYKQNWNVEINRLSGVAVLDWHNVRASYICRVIEKKF